MHVRAYWYGALLLLHCEGLEDHDGNPSVTLAERTPWHGLDIGEGLAEHTEELPAEHAEDAEHGLVPEKDHGHNGDHDHAGGEASMAAGGDGHHGHDDGPKVPPVSIALAVALLGAVGWIMSLFYFVNSPDEDIRHATWVILNEMVSIFLGVLVFRSTRDLSIDFFGESDGHHGPLDPNSFVLCVLRAAGLYLFWNVMLGLLRHRHQTRDAVGVLGGHICGFAAIEVFGNCLLYVPANLWCRLLGLAFSFLVIWVSFLVTGMVRDRLIVQKSTATHLWLADVHENEHDAASLCLGLLVSMLVRSLITGELPPVHGAPKYKSAMDVVLLFVSTSVIGVMVVLCTIYTHTFLTTRVNSHLWRITAIMNNTISLSMGWCFLYAGQWLFWNLTDNSGVADGGHMTARLIMALAFSAVAFVGIVIIDFFADAAKKGIEKGLRALLHTFGLLMGLAWEAAFNAAMEGIGALVANKHLRTLLTVGLILVLFVVVAPAWMWYMLPAALEEPGERSGCEETDADSSSSDEDD